MALVNFGSITVGTTPTVLGPFTVAVNAAGVIVLVDATAHSNPANLLTITVDLSLDGGVQFREWGRFVRPGGVCRDGAGSVTNQYIDWSFNPPLAQTYTLRVNLVMSLAAVTFPSGRIETR
jgi:hypothetical protein